MRAVGQLDRRRLNVAVDVGGLFDPHTVRGGDVAVQPAGDRYRLREDPRPDTRGAADHEMLFRQRDLSFERSFDGEVVFGREITGDADAGRKS